MTRDYKHRVNNSRAKKSPGIALWKWALVVLLLGLFIVFLSYLNDLSPELDTEEESRQRTQSISVSKLPEKKKPTPKHQNKEPKEPQYEFYTTLPEYEIVVPSHEIKTRSREERLGREKNAQYIIQAGSFRSFDKADELKAKLAMIGFESKVASAKIGSVDWKRVQLGPFGRSSHVSTIIKRLKEKGIDAKVYEVKK